VSLEAGTRVGRYTISRLVAQGGMAEVYRAEQSLTSGITRPVAVKVIRPEYSESVDFREMFLDEARTACTLSHPNIVHIYEVGETDDGQLYMAMELVAGETLATINRTLREHGERFSDDALFALGIFSASALEAVHALKVEGGDANLVHRDVSPHNLLLSSKGSLKLIDFGIAKAATNRNLTMPGVTKGKAGYFSPEQAMGKRLDGRSDLFSLGVTLYKLASGATPFDEHKTHGERHAALVRGQFLPLSQAFPGLPPGLLDVVDRALQVKPEDRFQTASQMREALEKAAFDAGIRIGQSSLLGYVDDEGEITATGGSRTTAAPSTQSLPRATGSARSLPVPSLPPLALSEHHTDKVEATPRVRKPWLMGAAFVAAVAVGIFGVLLASGSAKPEVYVPTPPVVPTPPAPVPVAPTVVEPGPEAVVVPPPPPVPAPRPTPAPAPRPRPVAVSPPSHPVAPRPEEAAPAPAAVIPQGRGKLRIGATQSGAVVSLLVGRDDWGPPPVNNPVASGQYTVTAKLADGRRSPPFKVSVYPDQTAVLVYDVEAQTWSAR
jgi:serine/threonine protein kinase